MDDIFTEVKTNDSQEDQTEYKLSDFMGEDKKYKTDADVAKAIVHKDRHIGNLESEMQKLREELNKRVSVEEALTKLQERRESASNQGEHDSDESDQGDSSNNRGLTQEDLDKLIESKFSNLTESQKKAANLQQVLSKASETWGSEAQARINQKARELGMTVEDLKNQAESNPAVFYRLVGLDSKDHKVQGASVTPSTDASRFQRTENVKNNAYYTRLLKEDPKAYFDPRTQNEMHNAALKLGEDFYK